MRLFDCLCRLLLSNRWEKEIVWVMELACRLLAWLLWWRGSSLCKWVWHEVDWDLSRRGWSDQWEVRHGGEGGRVDPWLLASSTIISQPTTNVSQITRRQIGQTGSHMQKLQWIFLPCGICWSSTMSSPIIALSLPCPGIKSCHKDYFYSQHSAPATLNLFCWFYNCH